MSVADEKRASREELSRLRIDRDAVALRDAPPWRNYLVTGGIVLAFLLLAFLGWKMTLGRTTPVRVAFAERTAPGAAAAGAVLTGSGYVVTGTRTPSET